MSRSGVRDLALLDLIDVQPRIPFSGATWRVVRQGRDATSGRAVAGRWDPGVFDVLYTCTAKDGALAEVHYHLSLQPVFPSKVKFLAHELSVASGANFQIADVSELARYGVDQAMYQTRDYSRTQQIGDCAFFLGFDGMLVPSARGPYRNLVLFTERLDPGAIVPASDETIDWNAWRKPAH